MSKTLFVNLPVRNLAGSTAFYVALGAKVNEQFCDEQTSSEMFSDAIGVALHTHERYRDFTQRPIGDARRESQALFALSADNRLVVDETLRRAVAAGGRADANPAQDHGFMLNRTVEDLDGNVWGIVWMDAAAQAQTLENA